MRSLAAARRSRIRRADPTGSGRHIREYENQLVALFQSFHRTIVQRIERDHHMSVLDDLGQYSGERQMKAGDVPMPVVDLGAMASLLDTAAKAEILAPGQQVTEKATQRAYQQGTIFAGATLRRSGYIPTEPGPGVEIRGVLGPADWRTLDWLKVRNLEVLKGITAETNKKIILSLTEGINAGEGMVPLANRITEAVDTIGITRARMMARTETMYAVNQGALLRYTQAGVEKVEWLSSTEDDRVCDECEALNGQIFDIDEVPEIPVHPNCRCCTAPVVE
jgi:SPP1 gp7 family putative phage head morphogenesis protein